MLQLRALAESPRSHPAATSPCAALVDGPRKFHVWNHPPPLPSPPTPAVEPASQEPEAAGALPARASALGSVPWSGAFTYFVRIVQTSVKHWKIERKGNCTEDPQMGERNTFDD